MKKLFTLFLTLFIVLTTKSQNSFPDNGNAGVGTNNPQHKFEVNGDFKTSGKVIAGSTFTLDGATGIFKNSSWAGIGDREVVINSAGI